MEWLQLDVNITRTPFAPNVVFALEAELGFVTLFAYREMLLWLGDRQEVGFARYAA